MKNVLFALTFISTTIMAAEYPIETYKAGLYLNQETTVCGRAVEVTKGKKQTFINIDGKYPNQKITFLIWDSNLSEFLNKYSSLSTLTNERVCAKGKIIKYKKQFQIIVNETKNMWVKP
ncbi:hypothetical protein [Lonepinella sp. BR2474]|uniref:hypothetical protein n=1 Tax=Lonepinella sp. BR2474 TaxID=3434548 RepID=UPI003F6E42FA